MFIYVLSLEKRTNNFSKKSIKKDKLMFCILNFRISDEKQEQLTKADMILSQFKQDSLKMDNDNKRYTEKCKKIASDLTKEESKVLKKENKILNNFR